jgi:enoyl-CoA hydratase/carnithine racemase
MTGSGRVEQTFGGLAAESFQFKRILYEKKGFTAKVTINRPEVLNCFDLVTMQEMGEAFLDASKDDSVAVLVVTGAGERAFCTGADLHEQQESIFKKPSDYHKWMYAFIEMHDRLRNIGKPTIARLNGQVVGGGNELNIACDLAIAAEHVTIRQVGAARGSVAAGGATQWLPLIVGDRRARQMLLLCESIDARTAYEWGLVNEVVPLSKLDAAVETLCQKLYNKLPECTRYTKQQLNFWRDFSWSLTIGHARDWLSLHAGSQEVAHGLESFDKKQEMNYQAIRRNAQQPTSIYSPGVSTKNCNSCAKSMPSTFSFCGNCGKKLEEQKH